MTEGLQGKDVLYDILRVLERIETKLDGHEERFRQFGELDNTLKTLQEKDEYDRSTDTIRGRGLSSRLLALSRSNTAGTDKEANDGSKYDRNVPKMPYEGWSIDQFIKTMPQNVYNEWGSSHTHLDRFYSFTTLSTELEKRLGSCWGMPDDGRLPLKFFKSNILKTNMSGGGPTIEGFSKSKLRMERELKTLCQFDETLRKQPGNDFVVVDFDPSNNSRMYRIGATAIGPELMVDARDSEQAPWSRLILYQGATTGDSIETERKRPEQPIPYFTRTDRIIGVWDHLSCHLLLKQRSTTTNPYASRWTGFHTTFYEIVKDTDSLGRELWEHGPLYEHPLGWHFRKCAFTMYAPASYETDPDLVKNPELHTNNLSRYWTLLLLVPSRFYNKHLVMFPSQTSEIGPGFTKTSEDPLGKLTQPGAELKLIGQGLEKISERWADFQAYFDYILDSGNALMHPAEHDNLLFDDGAFSRSRKYFWAIDCLTEFELSVSDNLLQWELYKQARIDHLSQSLPELDKRQLVHVERQYHVLQNQRRAFRQKLASIRALRDALFTASAVIESRASTRLGENVKLLTFVSIFFLPLSFTTSLWSINNTFSTATLIYVIIIVALLTYFAMFNINSLAHGFGAVYETRKKRVVHAMKADRREIWKQRGQRFEVFRPKHENPEPSEWYIPLYAVMHPTAVFGFGRNSAPNSRSRERSESGPRTEFSNLFRRRRAPAAKEVGRTDEGWVL